MKMNKLRQLIIASTLIGATGMVSAGTFSYNFLTASYNTFSTEIDGVDDDFEGNGINLNFAHNLNDRFALIGGYSTASADITYYGYTLYTQSNSLSLGGLYHTIISDKADFFAGAPSKRRYRF